ncbi:MAG: GntR family transcriptional regulator [Acidobacteriaceae bacterium]
MPSAAPEFHRDSTAPRVKQELLRQILSGELAPGARLVELKLAKEFKTSQGPVREALCELEGMELVTTAPYRGTRVRQVTVKDVREAYQVRAFLEELAGRQAATLLTGKLQPFEKAAKAVLGAAKRNDIGAYTRHDIGFHRLIVAASENRILLRTWDSLALEVHVQIRLLRDKIDLVAAQQDHWRILEALEKGNGATAGRLLRTHILNAQPAPTTC